MRKKNLFEQINRMHQIMGVISEAEGSNPIITLRNIVRSAIDGGESNIGKLFGSDFELRLKNQGINTMDELDRELGLFGRDATFRPDLKLSPLVQELEKAAVDKLLRDPNLFWLVNEVMPTVFKSLDPSGRVGNTVKNLIDNADLNDPRDIAMITDLKAYFRRAYNSDALDDFFDNHIQGRNKKIKPKDEIQPSPEVKTDEPEINPESIFDDVDPDLEEQNLTPKQKTFWQKIWDRFKNKQKVEGIDDYEPDESALNQIFDETTETIPTNDINSFIEKELLKNKRYTVQTPEDQLRIKKEVISSFVNTYEKFVKVEKNKIKGMMGDPQTMKKVEDLWENIKNSQSFKEKLINDCLDRMDAKFSLIYGTWAGRKEYLRLYFTQILKDPSTGKKLTGSDFFKRVGMLSIYWFATEATIRGVAGYVNAINTGWDNMEGDSKIEKWWNSFPLTKILINSAFRGWGVIVNFTTGVLGLELSLDTFINQFRKPSEEEIRSYFTIPEEWVVEVGDVKGSEDSRAVFVTKSGTNDKLFGGVWKRINKGDKEGEMQAGVDPDGRQITIDLVSMKKTTSSGTSTSTSNTMTKKEVEDFLTSPTEGWVKPLKFDPDLDNQTSYKVTDSDNPQTTGTITKVNGKLTIK